ncbi:hypothetical protein, partial [Novosphingobium sp.]|uniref:hypothetical protein n=1 Tax=Novosphingobium sp. TaxID=1874826 RepID=UPI0026074648
MASFAVTEDGSGRFNIPGVNLYTASAIPTAPITIVFTARDGSLSYVPPTSGVTVTGSGTRTLTISGTWG